MDTIGFRVKTAGFTYILGHLRCKYELLGLLYGPTEAIFHS
jgi:hypothetical protein